MKKVKLFAKIAVFGALLMIMGGGSGGFVGTAEAGIVIGAGPGGGEGTKYWRDCVNQTNYQECTQTVQTNTCTTLRDCWPGEA